MPYFDWTIRVKLFHELDVKQRELLELNGGKQIMCTAGSVLTWREGLHNNKPSAGVEFCVIFMYKLWTPLTDVRVTGLKVFQQPDQLFFLIILIVILTSLHKHID